MRRVAVIGSPTPQVVAAIVYALRARNDARIAPAPASSAWRAAARRETLRAARS